MYYREAYRPFTVDTETACREAYKTGADVYILLCMVEAILQDKTPRQIFTGYVSLQEIDTWQIKWKR